MKTQFWIYLGKWRTLMQIYQVSCEIYLTFKSQDCSTQFVSFFLYFQFNQLTFGLYLNILVKQLMYTLYHHFLQKVKQEEIQRYNKKHRAYLIRSGQLQIQQEQYIRQERPKYQNEKFRNRQNMRDIPNKPQRIQKNQQVPAIVQAKPRRQRQFNRPGKNSQNDNQKIIKKEQNIKQNYEEIPIKPAKTNARAQNFTEQPEERKPANFEEDRPIKKNKLTPQQIQYLNEAKSNPIPQISKPLNNKQNRAPIPAPSLQSTSFQAPVQPMNNKNERPIIQNKTNLSDLAEIQQYEEVQLVECSTCGRKFRPQALQKHENVCQKVFQQKRKPFEVKATDEQAQLLKKKSKVTNKNQKSQAEKKQAKQAKWKRQSQTFQNMIKRGRGQKVQVVEEDLRIQCPGCGRKFDEKAATRHIQFCTKKKKK